MRKKQIIDVTGTPLTPSGQGRKCLGNGEHQEYECCCDECDYYLYCFPQFDWCLKRNKFKKWIKNCFVQIEKSLSYDIVINSNMSSIKKSGAQCSAIIVQFLST